MNLSLPEIGSLAKRAARGAGYCWGLAEEAGNATRWLCANDLDGVTQLSRLLEQELSGSLAQHRPRIKNNIWQADQVLCPLITGSYLSDIAVNLSERVLEVRNLAAPSLLFPYVARLAQCNQKNYTLHCDDVVAVFNGKAVSVDNPFPDNGRVLKVLPGGSMSTTKESQVRVIIECDYLKVLNRYARNTYAPETEQSRLLGAGAGTSDND